MCLRRHEQRTGRAVTSDRFPVYRALNAERENEVQASEGTSDDRLDNHVTSADSRDRTQLSLANRAVVCGIEIRYNE